MILNSELDLDSVMLNQQAKCLGQSSFSSKVIIYTHTDTHTPPTALPGSLQWSVTIVRAERVSNYMWDNNDYYGSRCGHYIFALWFLSIFFIPRLISAAADWMSTILPQMVWP